MITFEDVDATLKQKSLDSLVDDYNTRQFRERNKNNERARFLLWRLFPHCPIPWSMDPTDFFIEMTALSIGNNFEKKRILQEALKQGDFKFSYELYCAMRFIDLFLTYEISGTAFETFWKVFFTIYGFTKSGDKLSMSFTNGSSCELTDALSQLEIYVEPHERRDNCHLMTKEGLLQNSNLVGAYYYIPYQFAGYIEHSVLIDPQKGMVYDGANNIALPLTTWESYYKEPSFLISGEAFQEIHGKIEEKYDESIGMATLEEVKRTLNKNK